MRVILNHIKVQFKNENPLIYGTNNLSSKYQVFWEWRWTQA